MSKENFAYNTNEEQYKLLNYPDSSTLFSDPTHFIGEQDNSFDNLPIIEEFKRKRKSSQDFTYEVKQEIKQEQNYKCAVLDIEPQPGEILQIHHKTPKCHGGKGIKENAVGVLPEVHRFLDLMALNRKIYFDEIMEEGREYIIGYLNATHEIQRDITSKPPTKSITSKHGQNMSYDIAAGGD